MDARKLNEFGIISLMCRKPTSDHLVAIFEPRSSERDVVAVLDACTLVPSF